MQTGSCLCGNITYEINAAALLMYHCHCSKCRAASGASYVTNIVFPASALKITRGHNLLKHYESSKGKYRYFCTGCGSPIYSHAETTKDFVFVRAGTLQTDPLIHPSYHAYASRKAPWVVINDELPQYAEALPGKA
jgi:hypothetical protein